MKYYLLLSLLLLIHLFVNSQTIGSNTFLLQGTIQNTTEAIDSVILTYSVRGKTISDRVEVKNNKYFFRDKVEEPTDAILQARYHSANGDYYKQTDGIREAILLFIEPGKISVYHKERFMNYVIKGSKSDEEFGKLALWNKKYSDGMEDLVHRMSKARTLNDSVAEEEIMASYRTMKAESADLVYKRFVIQNSESVIAPYVIERYIDVDSKLNNI
jgi:hypothetical protein